jgi:hypothetical protein
MNLPGMTAEASLYRGREYCRAEYINHQGYAEDTNTALAVFSFP